MRFDIPVYFQGVQSGKYNEETGDYGMDEVSEEMRYASVTSANIETLNLVYGEIQQGSFVIRIQNRYDKPFKYIRIGDKQYRVDHTRPLRTKQTFVVSEVQ